MKKNYSHLFFIFLLVFGFKANAQCTSCTTTITGLDASNHTVGVGTTLCISSTGTATGVITLTGGTLCNQGTINSTNLMLSSGIFNNYGTATIDSLLTYDSINNSGVMTFMLMFNNLGSTITNMGSITANFVYDSLARFYNLSNAYLLVNNDFSNVSNSIFFNYGYMNVNHDFLNSSSSYFETDCMMNVGHDWYNKAVIIGPVTSCGGFNITGYSYNTGSVGSSSCQVDLCDAGHPAGGIDFSSGGIDSTTTYCSCSNACVSTLGIHEYADQSPELIQNVYPNPASNNLTIELQNKGPEQLQIEVMDMMGRIQIVNSFKPLVGNSKTTLNVSELAQGEYILKISNAYNSGSKKIFTIIK